MKYSKSDKIWLKRFNQAVSRIDRKSLMKIAPSKEKAEILYKQLVREKNQRCRSEFWNRGIKLQLSDFHEFAYDGDSLNLLLIKISDGTLQAQDNPRGPQKHDYRVQDYVGQRNVYLETLAEKQLKPKGKGNFEVGDRVQVAITGHDFNNCGGYIKKYRSADDSFLVKLDRKKGKLTSDLPMIYLSPGELVHETKA